MIDLHCHVLPGIDDGPATIEGSLALARVAAAAGTHVLVATPHVNRRYPNRAETIAPLVEELNARLTAEEIATAEGVALEVQAGAEVALTQLADIGPRELGRLRLGAGEWLLVEPPFTPVATGLDAILLELVDQGQRVVLAHPERCPAFQRRPEVLTTLAEAGILMSATAGALVGDFGGEARRLGLRLAHEGLLHNVASDAHDDRERPPALAADLERAGLGPLLEWLTGAIPRAILGRVELPPRPVVSLPSVEAPRARRRGLRR
jgi:protein-tyrosine phosphatase